MSGGGTLASSSSPRGAGGGGRRCCCCFPSSSRFTSAAAPPSRLCLFRPRSRRFSRAPPEYEAVLGARRGVEAPAPLEAPAGELPQPLGGRQRPLRDEARHGPSRLLGVHGGSAGKTHRHHARLPSELPLDDLPVLLRRGVDYDPDAALSPSLFLRVEIRVKGPRHVLPPERVQVLCGCPIFVPMQRR